MSQESNSNTDVERVDPQSFDVAEEQRHELLRLFPEVRTEGGKIDFERLKLTLGAAVVTVTSPFAFAGVAALR
jgi:hypothetical protein